MGGQVPMLMIALGIVLPLLVTLLCTTPVWLLRVVRGRFLGVAWPDTSIWRAVGDFSIVFTALVVLANIGGLYRPLADCFSIALGHKCGFPARNLAFAWGFSFEIATLPLGVLLAVYACIEVARRFHKAVAGPHNVNL